MRVMTTDDQLATSMLRSLDWVQSVRADDGHLVIDAPTDRAWEITRALSQRAVYVREPVPVHRSLEEFFMEITDTDPTTGRTKS